MATRIASAVLWFVAISWATNFASTFLGLAAGVGYLVALAIASFIALDPLNALWRVPFRDDAQVEAPRIDLDRGRQGS
jgi:UDP-N-acetylmuramyl pentapeptide phosphotransferase/UDP-N-acetylglucosamine-1-phosphate transferase